MSNLLKGELPVLYKSNSPQKTTITFPKIESVQSEVIFTSSQEAGEGDATNLSEQRGQGFATGAEMTILAE